MFFLFFFYLHVRAVLSLEQGLMILLVIGFGPCKTFLSTMNFRRVMGSISSHIEGSKKESYLKRYLFRCISMSSIGVGFNRLHYDLAMLVGEQSLAKKS